MSRLKWFLVDDTGEVGSFASARDAAKAAYDRWAQGKSLVRVLYGPEKISVMEFLKRELLDAGS